MRICVSLSVLLLAACVETPEPDEAALRDGLAKSEAELSHLNEARENEAQLAYLDVKARREDVRSGIWVDPNGCDYYIGEQANGEGYLKPLLGRDGKPICGN